MYLFCVVIWFLYFYMFERGNSTKSINISPHSASHISTWKEWKLSLIFCFPFCCRLCAHPFNLAHTQVAEHPSDLRAEVMSLCLSHLPGGLVAIHHSGKITLASTSLGEAKIKVTHPIAQNISLFISPSQSFIDSFSTTLVPLQHFPSRLKSHLTCDFTCFRLNLFWLMFVWLQMWNTF